MPYCRVYHIGEEFCSVRLTSKLERVKPLENYNFSLGRGVEYVVSNTVQVFSQKEQIPSPTRTTRSVPLRVTYSPF
jgi:hypothetical protein